MRSTSSPMVLTWARFRQLRGRSDRSRSSMARSRSGEPLRRGADLAQLEALGLVLEVGHQPDQRAQGVAGRGERLAGRERAVGLDVEDQAVEVGRLLDPHRLDREGDAPHGREDRVDRDHADGGGPLVALGRDVAPAALDRDVDGQAALAVERGDVELGVEDLDVGGELQVAGGDVAGPRLSQRRVTGSSACTRRTRSFRFKMMSVTSSFTPGSVVNSCRASSKRTWVTAAPGIDDSKRAAQRVAERVAEARLERADGEPLAVPLFLAEGLDGGALDDEHATGSWVWVGGECLGSGVGLGLTWSRARR